MDLTGPGSTDHFDDLACRCATDQRIIDNDNPFAIYDVANRVEFQFDAKMPDRLLWLDKVRPT